MHSTLKRRDEQENPIKNRLFLFFLWLSMPSYDRRIILLKKREYNRMQSEEDKLDDLNLIGVYDDDNILSQ